MSDSPPPLYRKASPLGVFLGGLLIAAGLAMAFLCGSCALGFQGSRGSEYDFADLALVLGGVPALFGLAIAWAGVKVIQGSVAQPDPRRPT